MGAPSDPIAKLKITNDFNRVNFLKTELALGFTFSTLGATKYATGKSKSPEGSMASDEKAYQTVNRFLSDPKHSQHLTEREILEFTVELERLRERLDQLIQKFRK